MHIHRNLYTKKDTKPNPIQGFRPSNNKLQIHKVLRETNVANNVDVGKLNKKTALVKRNWLQVLDFKIALI